MDNRNLKKVAKEIVSNELSESELSNSILNFQQNLKSLDENIKDIYSHLTTIHSKHEDLILKKQYIKQIQTDLKGIKNLFHLFYYLEY